MGRIGSNVSPALARESMELSASGASRAPLRGL